MTFSFIIPKWESYNPRNDRKSHSWFRLQNTFFADQRIFGLSPCQVALTLFLYCESSKAMGGVVTVQIAYLVAMMKVKAQDIVKDLNVLHDRGLIELQPDTSRRQAVTSGYHSVTSGNQSVTSGSPTDRQTDNTLQTIQHRHADGTAGAAKFDLESLYKKYPRKEGKLKGMATAKTQIKTQADYDDLSLAIDKYVKNIKQEGTESRFIKHFSTFMNSWREWLDPETGTVIGPSKKTIAEIYGVDPDFNFTR